MRRRFPTLALCFLFSACVGSVSDDDVTDDSDSGPAGTADGGPVGNTDGAPGATDAAPEPLPGDGVQFIVYDEQNSQTDGSWGGVLTDIVQHIPPAWVSTYADSDKVTHGHETSHGIHADIRNNFNDTGQRANGFYVLEDRAALVVEPDMRKSQVAPYIPSVLRGSRFSLYVTGSSAWDDTPLYLWDEWNSYLNGTAVAVDLATSGMWSYGWRDACAGTIEFVAYAIGVGMAVEELDPTYFADYDQFREFLAWNIRRSMDLYLECAAMEDFAWDTQDQFYLDLRTHAQAGDIRDFVTRTYGNRFATEILGF